MPAPLTRRSVLGLLGVGGAVLLAGCSDVPDPEDDVPTGWRHASEARTPTPVADVPALLAALEQARTLHRQTVAVPAASEQHAAVLAGAESALAGQVQVQVLERLLAAGVATGQTAHGIRPEALADLTEVTAANLAMLRPAPPARSVSGTKPPRVAAQPQPPGHRPGRRRGPGGAGGACPWRASPG